jgi:ABC-type sugar transport system permease subunit/ABC-type glycerol-3-phosphate transport system substrate-binding protein
MIRRLLIIPLVLAATLHAGERVSLRLVSWAGIDEIPLDEQSLAEFRQLHPDIEVQYEPNPGRQYEEKILSALAADAPPDVFLLDSKLVPTFTNKKILLDLIPYLSPLNLDTSRWYSNALAIARRGKSLYALPKGFTPLMVYFNKRLFDQSSVPYPKDSWTWNDYLSIARQLTRDTNGDGKTDQYGTDFTNYYYYWIPWVWSAGGDVLSPDGATSTGFLDSERTRDALQFLIDLRLKHHVAPEVGTWAQSEKTGSRSQLFAAGNIAMVVDGHWRMPRFLQYIEDGTLDIGVVGLPRHPDGSKVNVMYESGWCVPVSSRHKREAVMLAAFMAGETACRIRATRRLEISSVRTVAEEIAEQDGTGMEEAFVREIASCRQPWGSIVERFSEIEWTLQDAVDEVMINDRPMHETMIEYAVRIDKKLADIRAHQASEFRPIREHTEIGRFLLGVALCVLAGCAALYYTAAGKGRKTMGTALTFLAPSLLHLVVFVFTPIIFSAYLSTHRWDIVVADKPFVGLENFKEMSGDPAFWNALKNTLLFTLNVPIAMSISLGLALMMHTRLTWIGFLRTIYFLPSVTSFVAVALVWMWIYHPSFGVANFLLGLFGIPPLQWLNSPQTAMISVMIFGIWLGLGYQMVIFLAGLQGIPQEFYEAARIDGASRWQLFRRITFPLLKPTTFFILVTSMIGSFQVFTSIYVMTAGGPVQSTDVIVYHIYQAAWEQLRMGYASALSWVLFVIIMVATWIQFRVMGRTIEY